MALIKCPECDKEISDASPACVYCWYPLNNSNPHEAKAVRKGTSLNAKRLGVIIFACGVCLCFAILLIKTVGGSNIAGTWTVAGYECKGISYKASDIQELCEIRGYYLLDWSKLSLKLTKNGTVYMRRVDDGKIYEVTGTYTVGDTFIEICSEDGEKKLLDYDGKTIYFDIPSGDILKLQK